MVELDFHTVLTFGVGIALLFTLAGIMTGAALEGARGTRSLAVGNLAFTAMLTLQLLSVGAMSNLIYAGLWSLATVTSAMHLLTLRTLVAGEVEPQRRWLIWVVGAIASMWVLQGGFDTAHPVTLVAALAATFLYGSAAFNAARLGGDGLRLPRNVLIFAFVTAAAMAVLLGWYRLGDLVAGRPSMPTNALAYFGTILLFSAVNIGYMLLMYLKLAARVERLAQTDDLTGALNRRGLSEAILQLRQRDGGDARLGSVMLFDLDHFKQINDTWGHGVGDEVLRACSERIRGQIRSTDLFARVGGEEFCVVFAGLRLARAVSVAERIRKTVFEGAPVATSAGELPVTASIGVTACQCDVARLEEDLRRADVALYAAKRGGRNRVVSWTPAMGDDPDHGSGTTASGGSAKASAEVGAPA
ncbi:MAG: GGDEF domain-containing protein [Burkholderiaceae bacterium]|nr:GGDEF domain-containing protein [Burkholderiaceae bacterium]